MAEVTEQTPLLSQSAMQKVLPTPLPRLQFTIVVLLQLAEPLTSNVISPFAPQLVRDIGVTHGRESQVGHYVGLLQSMFFVAEGLTVLFWSRLSDRIGRKPVIIIGLLGLSLSMYSFGLSKTFVHLMISRTLNGALNGNVGVMKSITAEITDSSNISRAFAYMNLTWSTGCTLGAMIGGWLYNPAKRFPRLFGQSEFHKTYPYFLPCAIPATFSLLGCIASAALYKETGPTPIPVLKYLGIRKPSPPAIAESMSTSNNNTPSTAERDRDQPNTSSSSPLPLRSMFTKRVIIASGSYASLAAVEITFRCIQPLFYSTPVHLGGLGLSPAKIGNILALDGTLSGLSQLLLFAGINDRWGSRNTVMYAVGSAIPSFVMFPVLSFVARCAEREYGEFGPGYAGGGGGGGGGGKLVWAGIALQVAFSLGMFFGYGAIFIFIAKASPNRESIGATNGISQTSVSIMRAVGPALANSLFSLSVEKKLLGGHLVYYVLIGVAGVALYIVSFLPRRMWDDWE
ncbi:major facilitator superfamily multidrug-resistance, DHA1 sub-family, partial [Agrocybe pediades]